MTLEAVPIQQPCATVGTSVPVILQLVDCEGALKGEGHTDVIFEVPRAISAGTRMQNHVC